MGMIRRSLVCALAISLVSLPFAALAIGCESSSSSGPSAPLSPDASTFDAPQTQEPDAAVPVDAGVDAAEAKDAADAADAAVVAPPIPFATGLSATSVALADGQIDTHWTIKDGLGTALTAYSQTDALGYVGYWLAPSATSKFISPFIDTVDPSGNGTFTYTTSFALGAEVDVAAVQLVIRYASDNEMKDILINGVSVGPVAVGGYSAFETLTATTQFVKGTNTVSFTTGNSGGPTGMRAEFDLTK